MQPSLKAYAKRTLRRLGYDVRRTSSVPDVVDFLASRNIELVLDVGANDGQFGRRLRQRGYRGRIISYEPVAETFSRLQELTAGDSKWDARHVALGASTGTAQIHVNELSQLSSLARLTPIAERWERKAPVLKTEEVKVEALDETFPEFEALSVFLKIDTQGTERQVLEGARRALTRIQGVQLELPILCFYEGNWSLTEALDYMKSAGFAVSQFAPVDFDYENDPVSWVETDCVFRRRGEYDV